MAGAFDREVQQTDPLWQRAHATYISNLQFAADECSKVYTAYFELYCSSSVVYLIGSVLDLANSSNNLSLCRKM